MKIHHLQRAIRRSDLQLTERVLLSALVDLVDWQTWQAETKIKTIEYETGLNRATIARKLNSLEERGFISRTNQTDARGYKESLYTINIKEVETQLSRFFPMSQSATPISQKATDRSQRATKRSQKATTNILLSSNSSLPNKDSISFNNSNTEENAQSAGFEGEKKEVRRIPAGQFGAGAILIDGNDWEPERKTNSNQAWIEGGWTPPSREERLKAYK